MFRLSIFMFLFLFFNLLFGPLWCSFSLHLLFGLLSCLLLGESFFKKTFYSLFLVLPLCVIFLLVMLESTIYVLNLSQSIFKYILVLHQQCKNITIYASNYFLTFYAVILYSYIWLRFLLLLI